MNCDDLCCPNCGWKFPFKWLIDLCGDPLEKHLAECEDCGEAWNLSLLVKFEKVE